MVTSERLLVIVFAALFPIILFSQQKSYKVVCDKTTKELKVVEAGNHSPNLIPVKAGFPYAAVARDWIKKSYPDNKCNPDNLNSGTKKEEQPTPGGTNQNTQQQIQKQNSTAGNQSYSQTKSKKRRYKNTSFVAMLLIHNMNEVLGVAESNLGSGLALEQLIGQNDYYLGTGAHFNAYSLKHGGDKFDTYMFKFPVFVGYRIRAGNFLVSFDAGVFISTKLNFFDEEYERFLRADLAKSTSYSFFPRIRVGLQGFQLEGGAQLGLSDVVENREKLNVYFVGLRFYF